MTPTPTFSPHSERRRPGSPSTRSMADNGDNHAGVCDPLLASLKECLLKSDCVVNQKRLPSDCLKNHFDELEEPCKHLRLALFNCKRAKVCHTNARLLDHLELTRNSLLYRTLHQSSSFLIVQPVLHQPLLYLLVTLLARQLDMRKRFRGNAAGHHSKPSSSSSASPVPVPDTGSSPRNDITNAADPAERRAL